MTGILVLIPAAGASRRMRGADKLLEPVGGQPLLRHVAEQAVETGLPVLVTLPQCHSARHDALAALAVAQQEVDGTEGMAASIRAGVTAAQVAGADGLLVMLADMPEIDSFMLKALVASFAEDPGRIVRAAAEDGTPGNPVILPARLFPALSALTGDAGAREVIRGETPRLHPLPGRAALTDLDTPEDWVAWRARKPR